MRRAGKVVREVLELVRSQVKPGATTLDLEKVAEARIAGTRREAGLQGLSRVSLRALHLGQQRGGARHSIEEAGPERRGHRFGGLRSDCRRLLRRRCHYGSGGREDRSQHSAAAASDGEVAACGHRGGEAGSDAGRYRRTRCRRWSKPRGSRWYGILWAMGSASICTKIRRCRTLAKRARGMKLRAGMVIAIEPMVNAGKPDVRVLRDGWTAVTDDGSMSAHFEHTVAVTDTGAKVLTE